MKKIMVSLCLSIIVSALQAQAPAGSKLAAEQAFTKELSRVFAYQKEHPTASGATAIKAPSLGQSGLLTLTFNQTSTDGNCREVATVPVDKIISVVSDTAIGFRVEGEEVQKIRLCSGKQPSHAKSTTLLIGTITDAAAAKGFSTDLETALKRLQAFYK
jgi:hypothetical protein